MATFTYFRTACLTSCCRFSTKDHSFVQQKLDVGGQKWLARRCKYFERKKNAIIYEGGGWGDGESAPRVCSVYVPGQYYFFFHLTWS